MTQKFQQRKTRRGWETVAGAALAVGAVVGNGAVAQTISSPAMAVTTNEDPGGGSQQSKTTSDHEFHIPAGTLTDALSAYQQATGLKVNIKIAVDELVGFRTAGVEGTFSNSAALRQLLDKTGLSYHFEGTNSVDIAIRNAEHVDVTSSVSSIALQQFPESLLDTAQTVNVVPQYIMQEQGTTTLRDGLRNVPGISMAAGEGGSQGDTLTIRGFNARNDIYLDGIRDFGSYYRDSFDYDSIDVLQGPAGVEFGRGSTGGVVNQESKQPQLNEFVHGNAQFGTNKMRRVSADINEPLKGVSNTAAFRMNVVGTQSMVAGRDIAETRRFGIAPSLAFGLNTPTRFVLQYLHESENSTPDYGLPYFGPSVVGANRSTYYGFAADNYLRTNPDVLTGKAEHDIGANVTVRNILRWANYPRDVRITEPQINTTPAIANPTVVGAPILAVCDPTIVNNPVAVNPTVACYPLNTPLSQVQVKRNQLTARSTEDMLWDQASATGHFNLWGISNDGIIMVEGGRERSDPNRNGYSMPYVPVINPNPYDPFQPVYSYPGVRTYVASQSFGLGFNDTLKIREWLQFSGGVRFDYFNTNSHNAANPAALPTPTPAAATNRLDKQPTYRAAVVVKPRPNGSVYFDYGTSFNPSAESLSLSANNAGQPPEENTNYELGAKWSYFGDRLNVNGSIFRTEKDNAHETDPNNSLNTLIAGTYLVRGGQFGAIGHLPQSFDLVLGYAYLDGILEDSRLNASPFNTINMKLIALNDPRANTAPFFIKPNGYPIANVPRNSGNVWVTHRLLKGFVGGFGGNYVGARRASSGALIGIYNTSAPVDVTQVQLVPKVVPGYYVFNLLVQRKISKRVDFQVNVNNIANKFYIDQPHPNHLVPGEGANAQFGFNYKF